MGRSWAEQLRGRDLPSFTARRPEAGERKEEGSEDLETEIWRLERTGESSVRWRRANIVMTWL